MIDTENNDDKAGNSNSTVKATNSGRHFLMVIVPLVVMSTHRRVEYESETECESTDNNDSDIVNAPVAKRILGGATKPGRCVGVSGRGGIDKEEVVSLRIVKIQLAMLQMK